MPTPIIADNNPVKVTLKKDETIYFCTCGQSSNQPYCDGSHSGSEFEPMAYQAEEDGDVYLCACKQTGNAPFCDGTHSQFNDEQVGSEGPERN